MTRNEVIPAMPKSVASPPKRLPAEVRAVWLELAEMLADTELVNRVDVFALEALSHVVARWRAAEERIAEDGHFLVHPNGHVYAHPAVKVADKAEADFLKWCQKFGLTPKDRLDFGLDMMRGQALASGMDDEPPLQRAT